jgi:UDP-glucose:(heptosyl)LPS alpha-1,3-glucosyltransferase
MSDVVLLKPRAASQGGLEKYTSHLAKAFVQKGLEVTLLTTGKYPEIEGVKVISLAKDTSFTWLHIRRFDALCKKWLHRHPSRIVFGMERTSSQTHYRAGSGVHAIYLARRKSIDPFWKRVAFPINPLHRSLLALEKQAFESPELKILFTNSEMVKQEILSLYSTPAQKIEVVHNGVEWQAWEQDFANSFNTLPPSRPYHFLFVGNGYQRKGLSFLLQGLSQLPPDSFLLTVIGKDKNPLFYAKMATSLGIKEKLPF